MKSPNVPNDVHVMDLHGVNIKITPRIEQSCVFFGFFFQKCATVGQIKIAQTQNSNILNDESDDHI